MNPARSLLDHLRETARGALARVGLSAVELRAASSREPFPDVALLNDALGMPSLYPRERFSGQLDAGVYFLDFNYRDRERTVACLTEIDRLRRAHDLRFEDKTLLLAACGLDPHGEALRELARQFAHHHVFCELWNTVGEAAELSRWSADGLYFVPVTAALDPPDPAARMPAQPNRDVFVSLGGDDDLDLVREVIRRRPELRFHVPDLSWHKNNPGRQEFAVLVDAPNAIRVRCHPEGFSASYRLAYARCDTVLVATGAAKKYQMRGGIRVADALRGRKRLVMTQNPMCELLMAQHERTCLVAEHDAGSVSEALDRMIDGRFQVDVPLYEAIRALTSAEDKVAWMVGVHRDPAAARRSPFRQDPASLGGRLRGCPMVTTGGRILDALFDLRHGQRLPVPGLGDARVDQILQDDEAAYRLTLSRAGARDLVVLLSTAPTDRFFRRTSRGHGLSYRGADVTADEVRVIDEVARHV